MYISARFTSFSSTGSSRLAQPLPDMLPGYILFSAVSHASGTESHQPDDPADKISPTDALFSEKSCILCRPLYLKR